MMAEGKLEGRKGATVLKSCRGDRVALTQPVRASAAMEGTQRDGGHWEMLSREGAGFVDRSCSSTSLLCNGVIRAWATLAS